MKTLYLKHSPFRNNFFSFNGFSYSIIECYKGVGVMYSLNGFFEWKPNLDNIDITFEDGMLIIESIHHNITISRVEYKIEERYSEKQFYDEIKKLVIAKELEQ